jgi:beta-lactamase class A
MHRFAHASRALTACLLILSAELGHSATWTAPLQQEVERIDRESPGTLGVYVKRLKDGETYSHGADQPWYLGSTVKVFVAIAVLQQVDAGRLKLSDKLTLQDSDRIEAGPLVWEKTGTTFTVESLLKRMLVDSDNTASNVLIRTVGEERVNESAKAAMGAKNAKDFQKITSLAQVRYDVYAEIHPDARKLTNQQLVTIAAAPLGPKRVDAVRQALKLQTSDLQAKTIDEAYDRYYRQRSNTLSLEAYGDMLETLVKGKLLSPKSQQLMFTHMKIAIFTNYRLQAGLPRSVPFIHKTGTQYQRACHVGVMNPKNDGADAIVVTTCAAGMDEQKEAGKIFERVGRAITQTVLKDTLPGGSPAK